VHISVDAKAHRFFQRPRSGQAILITILCNYGLPTEALAVEWCGLHEVTNDPAAVLMGEERGVPIYAYARVAVYAQWHPLRITTQGPGWWPALAIEGSEDVLRDLVRWEHRHPGLAVAQPSPAA
jgi:hypothetical protein